MYDIDSLPGLIELGHLNEKGVCEIEFDVTDWLALYPLGVLNITYMRPGESTVYPVDVTGVSIAAPTSGNLALTLADDVYTLTWTVSDAVTENAGSGSVVVELKEGTAVRKTTDKIQSYTKEGHAAAGDPPEPLASYIEKWGAVDVEVTEKPADEDLTQAVTQDATGTHFALQIHKGNGIASIVRTAGTGAPGTVDTYTITFDDGTDQTYQVAHGVQGEPFEYEDFTPEQLALLVGEKGDTGAQVESAVFDGNDLLLTLDDASEVRLTDAKITLKGDQGPQGIQGVQGLTGNGIASVLRTSGDGSPGTVDTYTITFTDATKTTFTVYNGQDYRFDVPMSWQQFQACVRDGTITNYFAVGDQFVVAKGATNLVFDIVDIGDSTRNVIANGNAPTDANYFVNFPNAKPVTLLMHDVINGVMFDNVDANYNITTQINSGATCVISLGYGATPTSDFRFTASKNLVVGGKIKYIDATHFGYYSTATATVESMSMAAGAEGDGFVSIAASLSAQNNLLRVQYGSNKYSESAIRQFLNAGGAAGAYWTSKSDYDLAPSWHSTLAGFRNGMDADFLAVIGETTREVELNTITDGGGNTTITDKIFLPSEKEIYGSAGNVTHQGVEFQEYFPLANIDKIKYDAAEPSTARRWWLRSPDTDSSYRARHVNSTTGALGSPTANSGYAASAACVIL